MTYEAFWDDSPELVRSYQEAEKLRTERENTFLWLQGRYFFDALTAGLSNFSAGVVGKNGKAQYTDKPYRVTPMTEEEKEAERQRKLDAYIEELKMFQMEFNKRKQEKKNVEC